MSHSVYVGNLPASITESDLELFFSLCGPIESRKVERYVDNKDGQRAYGFITFRDQESMQKALVFDQSNYQRHIIKLLPVKKTLFGTFLGGIPNHVSMSEITQWLRARYPNKFHDKIVHKENHMGACIFVNFFEEDSRQEFIQQSFPFTKQKAAIKEPTKRTADPPPAEGKFELRVSNIPYNFRKDSFRKLFVLFDGDVTTNIHWSENTLLTGSIVFNNRQAANNAMRFDGSDHPVNGWSHPIRMQPKDSQETDEYPYKVTLSNVNRGLELWDIEQRLAELGQAHAVRSPSCRNDVIVAFRTEQSRDTARENIDKANIVNGPGVASISEERPILAERGNVSNKRGVYSDDEEAVESVTRLNMDSNSPRSSTPNLTSSRSSVQSADGGSRERVFAGATSQGGSHGFGQNPPFARKKEPERNGFGLPLSTPRPFKITAEIDNDMKNSTVTELFERLGDVLSFSCTSSGGVKTVSMEIVPKI